jgi:HSP20 family molecular chaperone IbpA
MDLIDDPAESILTAVFEIPGIKTNDISLHILDGHLVVLGERRPMYNAMQQTEASSQDTENRAQAPKLNIPVQELRYGTFRRAILIPEGIKESDVKASLNEGMLTVTWPRTAAAAARTRRPHSSSPPTSSATVQ